MGKSTLTVKNPNRLARTLQSPRDGPEITAAVHVPLGIIALSGWGKASKALLSGGLGCAVMRISLRIDGVAQLLCHISTQIGHCALDLPQEPSDLVFLWGPSMVLVTLALVLVLVLAVVLRLLLVLASILALVGTISIWGLILVLILGILLDYELNKLSLTVGVGAYWLVSGLTLALAGTLVSLVGILQLLKGVAESTRAVTTRATL